MDKSELMMQLALGTFNPYSGIWTDREDLIGSFQINSSTLEGCNILCASYAIESYSGNAWVLYIKDGKLYEVSGSHCSCMGLEDQWNPEEVVLPELRHRLDNGTFFNYFDAPCKYTIETILNILDPKPRKRKHKPLESAT